jgi:GAF domain-containing protein
MIFLVSAIETRLRSISSTARLQALVVTTGVIVAFAVPLMEFSYTIFFGEKLFPDIMYSWLPLVLAFPVAIGYAIVKHDLFEIDAVVRQTYGYLVSATAVVVLYYTAIATVDLALESNEFTGSPAFNLLFIVAEIVFIQPLHSRAERFVDRTFYRNRTDYHAAVASATDRLVSLVDPARIRETLMGVIVSEFALVGGSIYETESTVMERTYRMGECQDPKRPPNFLVEALTHESRALFRYEGDREREQVGTSRLAEAFGELNAEVLIPMTVRERLAGFLSLGPRRTGKLVSREDLDLLRTLAGEGAIALENARLVAELADHLKQSCLRDLLAEGRAQAPILDAASRGDDERQAILFHFEVSGLAGLGSRFERDRMRSTLAEAYRVGIAHILAAGGRIDESRTKGLFASFVSDEGADPPSAIRSVIECAMGLRERLHGFESAGGSSVQESVTLRWVASITSGPTRFALVRNGQDGAERASWTATGSAVETALAFADVAEGIVLSASVAEEIAGEFDLVRLDSTLSDASGDPIDIFQLRRFLPVESTRREGRSVEATDGQHFVVHGQITEKETGRPLSGLIVRAFDLDLLSEDLVGGTSTDDLGQFRIEFGRSSFSRGLEIRPDLFLRVHATDDDRELGNTRENVIYRAEQVSQIDFAVPRHRLW